jgi:hypothetical protein
MVMNPVGLGTKNRCAGEGLAAIQQQTGQRVQPHPYVYGRVILIVTTVLLLLLLLLLFGVCPSARCTYATNAVGKYLDLFAIGAVSLNDIYAHERK